MQTARQIQAKLIALIRRLTESDAWRLLARWGSKVLEAGTSGYPPETKRRLKILNMFSYLIVASTLIYAFQHLSMDYERYHYVVLINLFLVVAAACVPFAHRISDSAGGLILVVAEFIGLFTLTGLLGRASGVHLQYFIVPAATFVIFGLKRLSMIVPMIAVALVLHLVSWFSFPDVQAGIAVAQEVVDPLYVQAAITTMALIAATVYYAFSLAENAKAEVDHLLRNILPDSIVERLKSAPEDVIADAVPEASILFADISGFVALAIRLGADRTVELLSRIVSEFDLLAEKHGVEKIKTIGDAYMVAAGIPEAVPDHVHRLTAMGFSMLDAIDRIRTESGLDIGIRIGMASGPVMAGVIGHKKFSYDVWGDAVNLASRLEKLSQTGRILVCAKSQPRLTSLYDFESRGELDIKGAGRQEAFYVLRRTG